MNATTEREQNAVILTGGRRPRSAGINLGQWKFDEYVDAAVREFDRLTAERDAARKELANLRAACSRKEDVYPTETVIIRSASDLLVEFSQFAFFLGDIRKSKEASYRAQYILAALGTESEASE